MTRIPAPPAAPEDTVPDAPTSGGMSRRTVVGAGGVACAGLLLTACGGGSTATSPGTPAAAPPVAPAAPAEAASPSAAPTASGEALASTSEIPVGGGKVFADKGVVVTQPSSGEFKAFSAVCTHQGCKVNKVADNLILCPCHGSKFSAADGSVSAGPAKKPLTAKTVAVNGDSIVLQA